MAERYRCDACDKDGVIVTDGVHARCGGPVRAIVASRLTYWCRRCQRPVRSGLAGSRGWKCSRCGGEIEGVRRGERFPVSDTPAIVAVPRELVDRIKGLCVDVAHDADPDRAEAAAILDELRKKECRRG